MTASEVCWTLEQYGCRGLLASVLSSTGAKWAAFSPASPGDLVLAFPNARFHCTVFAGALPHAMHALCCSLLSDRTA